MKKKIKATKDLIIPNSKFNLFIISLIVMGIVGGAIYYNLLADSDLSVVHTSINSFFDNIGAKNINYVQALLNSIINEGIYVLIIFLLGFSVVGIPLVILLVFLKGLVIGFTISSLIGIFSYKGVLYSFIYIFPTQLLSIFISILIGFYSISFSVVLFRLIFNKKNINVRREFKRYLIVLGIAVFCVLLYGILESYLFPVLLKLFISIFK